jgi:hypothetical protein
MAVQYAMMKKKKKMAMGGDATNDSESKVDPTAMTRKDRALAAFAMPHAQDEYDPKQEPARKMDSRAMAEDDRMLGQHGAMEVGDEGEDRMDTPHPMDPHAVENQDPLHEMDMVTRIMHKRYPEHFAEGGEVKDEEPTAGFESNDFDELDRDPPETAEADDTGANSGDEVGDEQEDDDRKDIVSRIMKSRAKKDRNPSPA